MLDIHLLLVYYYWQRLSVAQPNILIYQMDFLRSLTQLIKSVLRMGKAFGRYCCSKSNHIYASAKYAYNTLLQPNNPGADLGFLVTGFHKYIVSVFEVCAQHRKRAQASVVTLQLGCGGRCKPPTWGLGRSPGSFCILAISEHQEMSQGAFLH